MSKKRMTKMAKELQAIYDDLNEAEAKENSNPIESEIEKLERKITTMKAQRNILKLEASKTHGELAKTFRTPEVDVKNESFEKIASYFYDAFSSEFELKDTEKFFVGQLDIDTNRAKLAKKPTMPKSVKRIVSDIALSDSLLCRVSFRLFRPYDTENAKIKTLTKDQLSSLVTSRYHIAVDADGHGIELDSKGNPLEVNPKKSARK